MDLVIIFGPPAVGKMTVGQALEKITGLKLLHNHLTLELVNRYFDFGTPAFRELDKTLRFDIFKAVAKSDLDGLIFTFVWALNEAEDHAYVDEIIHTFAPRQPRVCLVELKAGLEVRLQRNKDEHRLAHKASKRNLAVSEQNLRHAEATYRMNTLEGELAGKKVFTIDNTFLPAEEVAQRIKEHFDL